MLLAQFTKVSKYYAGNPVFDEIDLEILEGERIGLVGENGGGKSTLFKLIAGIEQPTEGTVTRTPQPDARLPHAGGRPLAGRQTVFEAVAEISPEATPLPSASTTLNRHVHPSLCGRQRLHGACAGRVQ